MCPIDLLEPPEDAFLALRCDAVSRIGYGDLDVVETILDGDGNGSALLGELERVPHEVREDTNDLLRIAKDQPEVRIV